jgi:uncharacterized protein
VDALVLTLIYVAIALVVIYAALLAGVYALNDRLVFPASGRPVQHETPGNGRLAFEDLQIPVDETTSAHAWWIPGEPGEQRTMVFFHGNGYALEQEAELEAPLLHETGMNLLLVDYRGYGTSSALRTSAASTAADARAALRYLAQERRIPPSRIWIAGRSIGSVVATELAMAEDCDGRECAGLILLTPITNTADVKPFRAVLRPLVWLGLAKDFDTCARIASVRMPVLIVAGTADTVATPAMAAALHERATGPKRLALIEGSGHNDIWQVGKAAVINMIMELVNAA